MRTTLLAVGALCTVLATTAIAQDRDKRPGTTIQLPTFGVSVDAQGVLEAKRFDDPGGRLQAARLAAAKAALPRDLGAPAKLRKVSLVKLERAIQTRLANGQEPTDAMRHLAGMTKLQYVFFYPDRKDIVIAGPAEGWAKDAAGRAVGIASGRPVLLLEDLLVALRAFPPGKIQRPFIGCTIDPSENGLARLREFQKKVPRVVPTRARLHVASQVLEGTRDALGMSRIRVFGISPNTHFATTMIEADYRMKRIGMGLEPPPVRMVTFLGALKSARHDALQRWWFQPNLEAVRLAKDRRAMELVGGGVVLASEDLAIGPGGKLLNPLAKPNPASKAFTNSFTSNYEKIAAASPAFAQLRNLIDMLIAAAFVEREDFYGKIGWQAETFGSEAQLPTETHQAAKRVEACANALWKGSRLFAPAGGVSIQPHQAFAKENLLTDEDGSLSKRYDSVADDEPVGERWWWD
ncbi:MAG: DUF1598 domain-containing protein [Pirellulales bacterium]|nr:DUF1598 domain-containing protein [Pirellulales bacterium]